MLSVKDMFLIKGITEGDGDIFVGFAPNVHLHRKEWIFDTLNIVTWKCIVKWIEIANNQITTSCFIWR